MEIRLDMVYGLIPDGVPQPHSIKNISFMDAAQNILPSLTKKTDRASLHWMSSVGLFCTLPLSKFTDKESDAICGELLDSEDVFSAMRAWYEYGSPLCGSFTRHEGRYLDEMFRSIPYKLDVEKVAKERMRKAETSIANY